VASLFRGKQMDDRKILVLTGASRGIGHATVKRFSKDGWRVITCSRHGFPKNCPWEAGPEDHLQIDLATPADVERGAAELKSRLNGVPLHALVNNAGISPKSVDGQRLDTVSGDLALWQQVYQVNVFAPLMLAKSLLDCLETGSGTVVNVTSIAGSRVHEFAGSAYATSKAALSALTREMASDFGKRGVRVNAIAPGEIKTDILSPDSETAILPQIPMQRFGTADEVAETIFFLCSDQANYVNGAEIHVNGGQHV
jgi:NAD(P)-dependent dehydrogenase (short-subunit alcohol dehydrogenase family)